MTTVYSSARTARSKFWWIRRHTLLFLLIGYSTMALDGGLQASYFPNPLFSMLLSLIRVLNLGLWAVEDAKLNGRPLPLLSQKWFVIFGWVLVPCYVIRSRGWKGLAWLVFHGIGWLATTYIAFSITVAIAYA